MAREGKRPEKFEDDVSSTSSSEDELEREDSEGWEDAEPDEEIVNVKDFFSDETFPDAPAMIKYCKEKHGFDFLDAYKKLGGCVFRCVHVEKIGFWEGE